MQQDEKKEVVISADDIKNISVFFNHFNITIPKFLQAELDRYNNKPDKYTYDDQLKLKAELAHAIVDSEHELFKDELFTKVVTNCEKEWYNVQFNRDFENTIKDD